MTKRYAPFLLKAVERILADARDTFPKGHREFDRDLDRLSRALEAQGVGLFTIQLPALGKHFDQCLSAGQWRRTNLAYSARRSSTCVIPRLFWELHRRVFEDDGMLRARPDVTAIFFLRQLFAVAKKYKDDCNESRTYKTVQDFFRVEDSLEYPSLPWEETSTDNWDLSSCHINSYRDTGSSGPDLFGSRGLGTGLLKLADTCQKVADILATELGYFDPYSWRPRHGPGAVSDSPLGGYKYNFPNWPKRLASVFPLEDFAFANHSMWADWVSLGYDSFIRQDEGFSKLIKVPKSLKGPRLIASEPTAHQWCQQIIWDFFRTRYQRSFLGEFVHFNDQTHNGRAARQASRDGSSWTIDLSSASDSVSTRLVERIFRRNSSLLSALHACRTGYLYQEIDKKYPKWTKLKKFSTMGSACTFPVESHIFLVISLAACIYAKGLRVTRENILSLQGAIHVFGDDIVIPSYAGKDMEVLLGYLSFKVNPSKTFKSGRFRESCGWESFDGICVTPSYVLREPLRQQPESIASTVESSNNFFMKGLWRTADWLKSTVQQGYSFPVVGVGSGCLGFRSFSKCEGSPRGFPPPRVRFNRNLQRDEVFVDTVSTGSKKIAKPGHGPLLQFFTEAPGPDVVWSSGVADNRRLKIRRRWVPIENL